MARIVELFTMVSALAGIATFLGVRFAWRRSKNAAKRGFDIIHVENHRCPICDEKYSEDEIFTHMYEEHPDEVARMEEQWKLGSQGSNSKSLTSSSRLG